MKVFASSTVHAKTKKKKNKTQYWSLLFPTNGFEYGDLSATIGSSDGSLVLASRKISVPLKGVLRQTEDGFVYVDVSNNIIHGLFTLLGEDEVEKPPYFEDGMVGAHISVTNQKELGDRKFEDVGKEITFKLGKMYSVDPLGWDDMDRVGFVEVMSPELERIRKKHGLTKLKIKDEKQMQFHITFAVKRK